MGSQWLECTCGSGDWTGRQRQTQIRKLGSLGSKRSYEIWCYKNSLGGGPQMIGMSLLWFMTFLVWQRMAAPFLSIQGYLLCVTVFEMAVLDRYFHVIPLFLHCCSALLSLCGKRRQGEKNVLVVFAGMAHCRSRISHRTFVPVWHQHLKQCSWVCRTGPVEIWLIMPDTLWFRQKCRLSGSVLHQWHTQKCLAVVLTDLVLRLQQKKMLSCMDLPHRLYMALGPLADPPKGNHTMVSIPRSVPVVYSLLGQVGQSSELF